MSIAAFYTVRGTETSSSENGGDKYAQHDENPQENGHPTNAEDLYTTVNKNCELVAIAYPRIL